jgi:hypothetical protein
MMDIHRECIGKRVSLGEHLGWVIGLANGAAYNPIVRFDSGAKYEVPRWALTVISVQEGE